MGPLPLLAAFFLLGLALPWSPPVPVAVAVALVTTGVGLHRARTRRSFGAPLVLLAALLAGGARRCALTLPTWTRVPTADVALLRGRVLRGCAADGDRLRCLVDVDGRGHTELRLPLGRCSALPGDVLEALATVRPLVPMRNPPREPDAFASVLHGTRWTADAAACAVTARRATVLDGLRSAALRVRQRIERALTRALPPMASARARALLFGDRSALRPEEESAFRETGMAHLLAVSGAHVSLLLGLVGAALRLLLLRVPWLAARGLAVRLAAALPLPAVGFFVLVTGESPSAQRALYTACVAAAITLAGRRPQGEALVALVALSMGALDPTLVADIGWVLSVVAAWALARGGGDAKPPPETLGAYLRQELVSALAASARVALAVTPVLAWHFGRAPWSAVVVNAVAAPVGEALLLPAVLTTAAVGGWCPAELLVVLRPVAWLLDTLFALPEAVVRWPMASVALPVPTAAEWVLMTVTVVAACGRRARDAVRVLCVGALVVGLAEFAHRWELHPRGVLRVTALDVGQGDALVVELPDGEAMLIDAGGAITGGSDPGARVVVPWLALRRRTHLAAVVLSHPHPDHAGGLPAVLRALEVDELWDTGQGAALGYTGVYAEALRTARARRVPVRGMATLCGSPWRFHGATLEVLSPCPAVADGTSANDGSFVLRITWGRARVLLPGDLERGGEAALLPVLGRVDVLKVGHHGSRTSTSAAWLDVLRPRVALVSCGHPSPFGHPHAEVLERLRARGVRVLRTDLSGAVSVTLHADGRVE